MDLVHESRIFLDISSGLLKGSDITVREKKLNDLKGIFQDGKAYQAMDQNIPVYSVQAYMPVKEGTTGGLFFGNSTVYPGRVGNEYFMTRGHFHENFETAEYYWCIQGEGMLILMDIAQEIWSEIMKPGSVHYIPGNIAHRVVNTGIEKLVFNACWSSDAGHDYESIDTHGFPVRLFEVNGKPELIKDQP